MPASLGEQVTRSPDYPRGSVSDIFAYDLQIPLEGGLDILRGLKAITGAGALVEPDYHPFVPPRRALGVFDLIPRTPTGSDQVLYIEQTGFSYSAAAVAEGGRKPEGAASYEQRATDVTTIANWIPVTNRMLADSAVLESIIDTMLIQSLNDQLQRQIIVGDGASPNLRGILNTPGVSTYIRSAADTVAMAVRKAATVTILTGEVQPTGLVLHPNDLEALDLSGGGSGGGATFGGGTTFGTFGGPNPTTIGVWGSSMAQLTIIQTPAIPQGTGLIGAFDVGCMLFDRQRGRVERGYMDNGFVRNIRVLRAELEVAFAVLRPAVFTKITF